jgi:SOS-response transcriptional repressor LexA
MKKPNELIKVFRIKLKMTGEEFGEMLNISQQHISRLETGERKISNKILGTLKKIMEKDEYLNLEKSIRYYSVSEDVKKEIISELKKEKNEIPYFPDVKASAGYGCSNEENSKEYLNVPPEYSKEGNVAINVDGDSMFPKLETGDVIIVDTNNNEFCDNKIVVVNYNEELYVKKLEIKGDKIYLISINPYYPTVEVKNGDNLSILGKVIFSFRRYN